MVWTTGQIIVTSLWPHRRLWLVGSQNDHISGALSTQILWLKMVNPISIFDHGEYTLEILHWQYASFLDTQSWSAEWMHFIWTNYNFKADGMATSFEVLHFNLDNYIKVFHPWVIWCLRKTTSAMAPIYLGNFILPALGLVERLMTYTSHLFDAKMSPA